jgi:hypothetical protein
MTKGQEGQEGCIGTGRMLAFLGGYKLILHGLAPTYLTCPHNLSLAPLDLAPLLVRIGYPENLQTHRDDLE